MFTKEPALDIFQVYDVAEAISSSQNTWGNIDSGLRKPWWLLLCRAHVPDWFHDWSVVRTWRIIFGIIAGLPLQDRLAIGPNFG